MSEPQTTTGTQVPGHEAEPAAFGFLTAPMAISFAVLVVLVILIWKKVPAAIGKALDAEYEAKSKSADKDRKALLERAKHEAEEIVAKAKSDAEALIERRTRMAEDKIAAEERTAIEQLRAAAADAAMRAAARLIAERHDAKTDAKLVDQAIKEIGGR